MQAKQWQRQHGDQAFLISTAPDLISRDFVQASFADPAMYWATPIAPDVLETMIRTSCFFGLYIRTSDSADPTSESTRPQTDPDREAQYKQIGLARLVTDFATIAFLTDVFVAPEFQGKGLAKWMMCCVKEYTDAMPAPRRVMFMAKNAPHAIKFYEESLDARVYDQERSKVVFMSTQVAHLDG